MASVGVNSTLKIQHKRSAFILLWNCLLHFHCSRIVQFVVVKILVWIFGSQLNSFKLSRFPRTPSKTFCCIARKDAAKVVSLDKRFTISAICSVTFIRIGVLPSIRRIDVVCKLYTLRKLHSRFILCSICFARLVQPKALLWSKGSMAVSALYRLRPGFFARRLEIGFTWFVALVISTSRYKLSTN